MAFLVCSLVPMFFVRAQGWRGGQAWLGKEAIFSFELLLIPGNCHADDTMGIFPS